MSPNPLQFNVQLSVTHLHQGASSGNKTFRWLSARIRFVPEESLEKIVARGIVAALSWWRYCHHHHHQNNHHCQITIKENYSNNFPTRRIPLSTTQDLCRSITAIQPTENQIYNTNKKTITIIIVFSDWSCQLRCPTVCQQRGPGCVCKSLQLSSMDSWLHSMIWNIRWSDDHRAI